MVGKNLIVQCNGYPVDDIPDDEPSPSSSQKSDTIPEEPFAVTLKHEHLDSLVPIASTSQMPIESVGLI